MSSEHARAFAEAERLQVSVPEELQAYDQFVGWELFTRSGKPTKVPLNPHTGYYAKVTDPQTWGSLHEALALVKEGRAKGIGFVFSENDPFTGTDLDHCITDGVVDEWAKDIVDRLDSYTELSPSQTGLHILTQATIPQGRRKDQLEMYASGRYFTLTGKHLEGTPEGIRARQDEQEALYRLVEPPKIIEIFPGASSRLLPVREDDDVVKKATEARNGEKFFHLWNGDISDHHSKSEADFDLVLRLLYWCNDDVEQVRRLFEKSGLYDEKTNTARGETDYLGRTIQNALRKRRKHT